MHMNKQKWTLGASGFFTDSTMQWLEKQFQDIQKDGKTPLVAMHHNLAIHNELLNNGYTINDHEKIAKTVFSISCSICIKWTYTLSKYQNDSGNL